MKGTILCCLRELAVEKFGRDVWENVLEKAGMDRESIMLAMADMPDEKAMAVLANLCGETGMTLEQVADAFGEYWAVSYAPRIYKSFYIGLRNSKDMLMKADVIHDVATKMMRNAAPPRFIYVEKDKKTLLMTYNSSRNMMPFFLGLIKGVGKYFNEDLTLNVISSNQVEITFP